MLIIMIFYKGGGGVRATRDGEDEAEISQELLRLAGGNTGRKTDLRICKLRKACLTFFVGRITRGPMQMGHYPGMRF